MKKKQCRKKRPSRDVADRTVKVPIFPDKQQAALLENTMKKFMLVCAILSRKAFQDSCYNAIELQQKCYSDIRNTMSMPSMMICSACRVVVGNYRAIAERMKNELITVDGYTYYRDLSCLEHPLYYHTPQLVLQRNYDWSIKQNGFLSLNTVKGRISVPYNAFLLEQYTADAKWKFGAGRVIQKKGKWFFYITVSCPTPKVLLPDIQTIVGVDRGIVNLYVAYDSDGNSDTLSGKKIQEHRDKCHRVRQSLQSKGTKGAKRVLKKISGRENSWMCDVNHCASKALVSKYEANTLIVFENLENVSFDEKNLHSKKQSREQRSWAFYQFEQMMKYKAKEKGILVVDVDPSYTSQRCPICGKIHKEARHRDKHLYICPECGFQANDDLVGAMNIWFLGTQVVSGVEDPHFSKT